MEQKDEATVAHGQNIVRLWRRPGPESMVIVQAHAPERGLQIPGFVRLLELQGYSSFRFSTFCCSSSPHNSGYAKCLRAETLSFLRKEFQSLHNRRQLRMSSLAWQKVDAQMADLELSLFKQSIVNHFS
ncbi:hypothetical protein KP509_16G040200 [Ceratopteris richardii]|uniref:Uncharacterized protein n=1 Tax=Ceratopteris richardii TaxID=49495 RepID=A0A8T2SY78_CERRI|nr:hypothetical protein KP509_16G040200 [Ceratopteris richardii]